MGFIGSIGSLFHPKPQPPVADRFMAEADELAATGGRLTVNEAIYLRDKYESKISGSAKDYFTVEQFLQDRTDASRRSISLPGGWDDLQFLMGG